jgi:hypothetical protein
LLYCILSPSLSGSRQLTRKEKTRTPENAHWSKGRKELMTRSLNTPSPGCAGEVRGKAMSAGKRSVKLVKRHVVDARRSRKRSPGITVRLRPYAIGIDNGALDIRIP